MIENNLDQILKSIPSADKLIVVSKNQSTENIKCVYNCGHRVFGENKVRELAEKAVILENLEIDWHFIGHLQSNKINNLLAVKNLKSIHSIDSIKLLNKLLSKKIDNKIGVFFQVNTSGESEKSGFTSFLELKEAACLLEGNESFYFQGLMTIGKIRTNAFKIDADKCFSKLVELKAMFEKELNMQCELSMGMSQDYQIAIEHNTDWIRVGSKIFKSEEG